ncbi:MAG TPA: hypothetical protein VH599_02505 [Ktedonobacterales bacterium]|jgi:hypothetical protein
MKPGEEQPTPAWLDDLDAIIAGQDSPAASEDELLQLAQRLSSGLTPLRTLNQAAEQRRVRLLGRLHATQQARAARNQHRRVRFALLLALLLLVVLASGTLGAGALRGGWGAAQQVWHAATSLQQVQGISLAQLERPHPGLHPLPLLPTALPGDTQGSAYGVITDARDPNLLKVFVATWRMAGQDVSLYEQPTGFPLTSSAAQTVPIGALQGQVFVDESGNHALQWYQDGMECQLTSTLPVERLVALARDFQPIKNWDLFR